jgi:hypothetical protein
MCAERFLLRRGADRHPAHGEHFLDPAAIEQNIAAWPESSPIGVGHLVRVDTTRPVDVHLVARQVLAASR